MKSRQAKPDFMHGKKAGQASLVISFRTIAILFFLLLCLTSVVPTSATAQSETDYDRLEQAAELIRQGQLLRAEAELDAILRRLPGEPNALNFLGVIRARLQRPAEAEQLFLRVIKSAPTLVGAYVNLGHLYMNSGNLDRALWAFSEASKLAPDREEINFNLASIHVERREFERALVALGRIPRSSFGVEHLHLILKSYLELRRTSEARTLVASVDKTGSVTAQDAANFAALFASYGLLDESIEILEAARRKSPDSYAVLYNLGASYFQKGDMTRAEEFFTATLAAKPDDVAALRSLARVARARGDMEKSLANLVRARKLLPNSQEVLYDFGLTALHMELLIDALPVFEELQRLQPDNPPYLYMLAAARLRKGEKGQAEALLRRYVDLRPRDSAGYYLLGVALKSLNRFNEARSALQRSLALGSNHEAAYLLGLIANTQGNAATAIPWLKHVLKSNPNHAGGHAELGIAYAKQNDYPAARAFLERAVELDPTNLRAHYHLGLIYGKLGDKERSQRMLSLADKLRAEQRRQEVVALHLIEPPQ